MTYTSNSTHLDSGAFKQQGGKPGSTALGLFQFGLTDYHAILGVPVDASPKEIRQRYKQVVRLLHPDTCLAVTQVEKDRAARLLSKMVIPASTHLSKNGLREEYMGTVGRMVKHLSVAATKIRIHSQFSTELAEAGDNLETVYKSLLQNISLNQYHSLDKAWSAIALLSELNMVYLIQKEKQAQRFNHTVTDEPPVVKISIPSNTNSIAGEKLDEPAADNTVIQPNDTVIQNCSFGQRSLCDPYIRRAAVHMTHNNFVKAIVELRDALRLEPDNSSCHSLLGMAYLKENMTTMARVYINRALELNPQDARALSGKKIIEKLPKKENASKTTASHFWFKGQLTDSRAVEFVKALVARIKKT